MNEPREIEIHSFYMDGHYYEVEDSDRPDVFVRWDGETYGESSPRFSVAFENTRARLRLAGTSEDAEG